MYLSDPLVSGFTTGAAFHILSSQVRHFLGLKVPSGVNSGYFGLFKVLTFSFEYSSIVFALLMFASQHVREYDARHYILSYERFVTASDSRNAQMHFALSFIYDST